MSSLHIVCISLAVALSVQAAPKNQLGSLVPLCSPDSSDFNNCVKDSANKLLPQLKNGKLILINPASDCPKGITKLFPIPLLKLPGNRGLDFPPLEPLRIPSMNIGSEGNAVYLKLALTNTLHNGFSDLRFNSVDMDMSRMVWTMKGVLPQYSLTGDYQGQGKILVLPLGGEGVANFTLSDVDVTIAINGEKKMVNGQEYLEVKEAKVDFGFAPGKNSVNIKRTKGDLSNADHMSKFIRENADEVLKGVEKSLEDVYTDIVTGLLRRLFNKVPYQNLMKQ